MYDHHYRREMRGAKLKSQLTGAGYVRLSLLRRNVLQRDCIRDQVSFEFTNSRSNIYDKAKTSLIILLRRKFEFLRIPLSSRAPSPY